MNKPFVKALAPEQSSSTGLIKPPESLKIKSGLVMLNSGEEVGTHSTENREEILVVLEGSGRLIIQDHDPLEISGGHIAYVPPHSIHNVVNDNSRLLRYIYIVSPAE
ncbi:cupin domain-containing protein [bacterium]|nr:cupin domain-containing protein [bacterium]